MSESKIVWIISNNHNKVKEINDIINSEKIKICRTTLDGPIEEIQGSSDEIIQTMAKDMHMHFQNLGGIILMEDSSFEFEFLKGIGPYIKDVLKNNDISWLSELASKSGKYRAISSCYCAILVDKQTHYCNASVTGTIVSPRGSTGFGYDQIFQPDGHDKTYGEMTPEEKNSVSARAMAIKKAMTFIE